MFRAEVAFVWFAAIVSIAMASATSGGIVSFFVPFFPVTFP